MTEQDKRAILRKRAEAISSARTLKIDAKKTIEVLEFCLSGESYALQTTHIKYVCSSQAIIKMPCVPAFVFGIFNHKGSIVSVIDLRVLFDLNISPAEGAAKIIILSDGDMEFGVLAESIGSVSAIDESAISRTVPTLSSFPEGYVKGIVDGKTVVLDAEAMLKDNNLVVFESIL